MTAQSESEETRASTAYLRGLQKLLERLETEQGAQVEAAAQRMAGCLRRGAIVHLFGSGHSMLPALEVFPRYGSFVGLHPIIDPRLLWFNVLGSFGVPEMLFLQNTEGYADVMLDGQHLREGDVLLVFSHGGTSAVVVDAARYAKDHGLIVVAVSSSAAAAAPPRHSSGLKLSDLADLTIDTNVPRGEALVDVDGLDEPVGAASTVLAMSAALAVVSRTAQLLVSDGHPLVQSVRAERNETAAYRSVYDAYEASLRQRPNPVSTAAGSELTADQPRTAPQEQQGRPLGGPRRDLIGYGRNLPPGGWRDGARIAISLVVNYEEGSERSFAMGDPDQESATEWNSYQLPIGVRNLAMETMYEYGSRVGIWRIFELLNAHEVKATFFACAVALEQNPAVAEAILAGGHGVVSHGYRWEEAFRLRRTEEREHIRLAVASFEKSLGTRPRGWYCRYGPSINTRELLVEEGFEYDCDAYNDDLPYFVDVHDKRHLVVPYTPDVNDFRFWQSPGLATASQFFDYLKDSFDVLYAEGAGRPRMMSIGLHPRQIGRPGRISGLARFLDYTQQFSDVSYLTRDEIADAWLSQQAGRR